MDRGGASGSGSGLGVLAVSCWSFSLLSVHVCRSFDPLDLQDRTVTGKLRPEEDSDANKSCPRCKQCILQDGWLNLFASLLKKVADPQLKFDDGKELEPTGNAFQVKGTLSIAATLVPFTRLPEVHFCIYERFSTLLKKGG